ncbi:CynX/NimT family MFS transporter [Psittacicella gerlachiana]|uniref:Major facilitator superfamily (MFS) profile domain-containing protein n=1 Tax=Psittacicella gerlachiana TaxID=2028574 RepID=A0A3A1Y3T0_9GAMM|nr:MFS transporter [Psittacicella gerlachiana]RIY31878.1 hypothetical protein CKF59_07320 [Psittacicella gerlachiana]
MIFKSSFSFWYTAVALCLVTLLTRAPFTEISPIMEHVALDLDLTKTQQGIVLSLPTFVMAIFAALVAKVDQKVGLTYALLYGMIVIVIGIAIRDYLSSFHVSSAVLFLYLGTLVLSIGITILSVLYPSFINGFYPNHLGILNSINGANISVSSFLGTLSAVVMIGMGYSWQQVGTLWIIITILIILFYLPSLKFTKERMKVLQQEVKQTITGDKKPQVSMWKQLAPWCIGITLGIESANYYFALSWFKPYIGDLITNEQFSFLVNIFQVLSLLGSLVTPVIVIRYEKHLTSFLVATSTFFALLTIAMFYVTNYYLLVVIFVLFGAFAGILLAILLLLLSYKTKSANTTSKMSSVVNCVGFLITGAYLLGFGWLYDITGSYKTGITITILGCILLPLVSYIATKKEILE